MTTQPKVDLQWLEERRKGIGGSDIPAILGLDRFRTPHDVYLDKTGQSDPVEENYIMRVGKCLEDGVAQLFTLETGIEVSHPEHKIYTYPAWPNAKASVDRMTEDGGVLEIKTTRVKIADPAEDLPQSWYLQCQWYMGIYRKPHGYICWLGIGFDLDYIKIDADPELFAEILDEAKRFWVEHVQAKVPPSPINVDDIKKMWPRPSTGKSIEASDVVWEMLKKRKEVAEQVSKAKADLDDLDEQIKLSILDAEVVTYNNMKVATWKQNRDSVALDADLLKAEMPDVYAKYLKSKPGNRVFKVSL